MMSKKCKYAFKALAHLAKRYPDTHCQTAEIARLENIPRKFLELILLDLKKGGFVNSKQGAGGGYYLVKAPETILIGEIYRLFDGAIALLPCVSLKFYEKCKDCPYEVACGLHRVFLQIRDQTLKLMLQKTVSDIL